MEKRDALKIWTVLLAILTFSLSLLGTFLVRSGVLTSVHSFASDPTRGLFILAILSAFVGGALFLFVLRSPRLEAGGLFAPVSREGALVFNNLILSASAATVLIGTLYPVVYEALTDAKISVGAPFFNLTFGLSMIPLLIAVPFGPLLAWKRGDLLAVSQRLMFALGASILAIVLTGAFMQGGQWLAPIGVGLAVWLMVGAFAEVSQRSGFRKVPFNTAVRRLIGLPRSVWATAFAHFGIGVTLLGIVAVTAFETETITVLKPEETVKVGEFTLRHDGYVTKTENNYSERSARISIIEGGETIAIGLPSKRFFPARQMPTSEASIHTFGFSQLYLALGDVEGDGSVTLRIWWKPLILLIWLGTVVMVIAGAVSLSDRRLRIGAPARRQKKRGKSQEATSHA